MSRRLLEQDGDITRYWHDLGDKVVIESVQDVGEALEQNKRLRNSYSKLDKMGDGIQHVGFIPTVVMERWIREDGINYLSAEHKGKLLKKLASPEYAYLRTHPGKFA